jgi:NAD(P)-dependent dehydrogenase (short-subunit alcohol dehydrogenase family)
MPGRLDGRTAIVTGAGRGIGRAVALLLGQEGASVVVNDYGVAVDGSQPSEGPAKDVADEIKAAGGNAVPNFDTVATVEGGERLVQTALDAFGRLDILINVAGILRDRMIFNMTEEEWDAVIAVHLKGHYCTTKPASVVFRQQRFGRIVNFSSGSGLTGNPGQANYGAAKAGIAGFTRVVARDLGRYGVTCNAISPGAATRMTQSVPESSRELRTRAGIQAAAGQIARESVLASMREPEYVAPMTVFLCTDDAWNINGKIFAVSGGTVSLLQEEVPYRSIIKQGLWTVEELRDLVPGRLMFGLPNPAPPPPDLELPGRPARQEARA